ncbi:MAG: hypothetical protein ACI4TI_03500 [Christensenellales bacterium]
MEYILKIKTTFDCMLSLNNSSRRKLESDSFQTFKLNLSDNENLTIFVEPTTKSENLILPYNLYIKNTNQGLNIESSSVNVLNYKNVYLIKLEKLEVVKNMKVLLSAQNYSVFNTFCTNVTLQNNTFALPSLFEKVESQKSGVNTILTFDEKYAFIFAPSGEVLFNDEYSQMNIKNNEIEILTNLADIAKHSIITTIRNKDVSTKTVYQLSHPKLTTSKKLIPIAFLQALKINNINLAKHYLTQHLQDIATLQSLKSFFGDYKKVELDGENIVLFYDDKTHKIFSFEFYFDKISKINVF